MPKYPKDEIDVGNYGVDGDYHAGPISTHGSSAGKPNERQVSIVSKEVYDLLTASLDVEIEPGAFGENMLVEGLGDLSELASGDVLRIGEPCGDSRHGTEQAVLQPRLHRQERVEGLRGQEGNSRNGGLHRQGAARRRGLDRAGSNGRSMTKRVLIVGAGAVGSYISGWLSHEGHDVTVLDPWTEHVKAVNERGLSVSGPHEPFTASLEMLNIHEAQRLTRRPAFDIGLICVKSFDTSWAATLAARFIGDDGYLVSAQNCWNDPALAAVVGADRAVGLVMSSIQVALYEPGVVARGGKETPTRRGLRRVPGRRARRPRFQAPARTRRHAGGHRRRTSHGQSLGRAMGQAVPELHGQPGHRHIRHGYVRPCQ